MGYILGLDIGSASVGWGMIGSKEDGVIDLGVRVFPEGVDRDTKGAEISKNENRRLARGARRMQFRRRQRKDKLFSTMQKAGLLPKHEDDFSKLLEIDPYQLRAKGLDQKLEPYEFGRLLYNMNQRRGFWSNRKSGKSKDDGVVNKNANELQKRIDDTRCRTLGEYYASLDTSEHRIRGHYTFRSMYRQEFDALWEKQSQFYPEIFTDKLKKKIGDETIFFQRPLKPSDNLIGDCMLEAGEKRCERGDWYARRFRIYQDINNLKLINPDGALSDLTEKQRAVILEQMISGSDKVSFDSLRKKLGLVEEQTFNVEEGSVKKAAANLKGDEFNHQLKKAIGAKAFAEIDEGCIIEINDILLDDNLADEDVKETLIEQYGFSEQQAEDISTITLPQKYMSYSREAIKKLLPFMAAGMKTHDAVKEVYGEYPSIQKIQLCDKLPIRPDFKNPLVNKAVAEVRKVVNSIVERHGKPDSIVIEMARDVKGSLRERDEMRLEMYENQRNNDRIRKILVESCNIPNPSRNDIIKYKLWEECSHICPYTGRAISLTLLFGLEPEFDIEHIIPYSRCLDDGYMNKTLCERNENRLKGEKTPYEYYNGKQQYEQIMQRLISCNIPYPKRKKFMQKEVELAGFIERQLNDTRYITKEVVGYLKMLGVSVRCTKGKSTSELRHSWGLNSILNPVTSDLKNRDDHRHHTIDAVLTALTTPKHLQNLAFTKYAVEHQRLDFPWDGFRTELEQKLETINVSYRVTRKVSGKLHEETSYGPTGKKDSKGQDVYVYRKKLEDLTPAMVMKIVDPIVRDIVCGRLREHSIEPGGKGKIDKKIWTEPLYMRSVKGAKVQIKKVRICDVFNNMIMVKDKSGKPYRAVSSGNNHHIEIFEYTDKKGNTKRDGYVITMFEAVQRSRRGEPVICKDYGDGRKFICSLSKNEMFMMKMENGSEMLHRVQKLIQDGRIVLRPHTYAGEVKDTDNAPLIQRKNHNTLNGYKVAVDPLGKIYMAND